MNQFLKFKLSFLFLFCFVFNAFSDVPFGDFQLKKNMGKGNKFHFGLYVGAYFANNYTATMYDGYGFDFDGKKNDFEHSFMYEKIIMQNGGGIGYNDNVADALHVAHDAWHFDETDMPTYMNYVPAIMIGLNCQYLVGNNGSLIFNVNATKLTVNGAFNIVVDQPVTGMYQNNIKTFPIKGGEQRLLFQLGYQKVIGKNRKMNPVIEAGFNVSMAKFEKNYIQINNLNIDLTAFFNDAAYYAVPYKKPLGVGIGAFAGIGLDLTMSPKWTVQLLYSPCYDKINMGVAPKNKLQNGVGLRFYYNLKPSPPREPEEEKKE